MFLWDNIQDNLELYKNNDDNNSKIFTTKKNISWFIMNDYISLALVYI